MRDPNPNESLDAEGIPGDLLEPPPGIDVETEEEGMIAPRNHSIAAGSDPAYPNTAAENARPESVAARAAREEPEPGRSAPRRRRRQQAPVAVGEEGYLAPEGDEALGDAESEELADRYESEGRSRALSPEEAAMHVRFEGEADELEGPGEEVDLEGGGEGL